MKIYQNQFGEIVTRWKSYIHPDNPNFMQKVNYTVYEKPDGRILVCYDLGYLSKTYYLYNMTKNEAIEKFIEIID